MRHKPKPIPAVSADLIIKGNLATIEHRERLGPGDTTIALVAALADKHSPDEILAVSYRLGALAKIVLDGDGRQWAITVLHQEHKLVNEVLFRAAARAPLFTAKTVGEVAFDPDAFQKIALEEAQAEGSA